MNTKAIERIKGYCCEVTQEQWNELVRVAEEVGVKVYMRQWRNSGGTMFASLHTDKDIVKDTANIQGYPVIPFPDFLAKLKGEEKWEPKAGEMVEVSGSGLVWWEREFIAKSRGQYVGWTSEGQVHAWAMCRPARHTITRA
jgi:hypothetical protein